MEGIRWPVIAVWFFMGAGSRLGAETNEVPAREAIVSLEEAHSQWQDRVEFTSTFEEFQWSMSEAPKDLGQLEAAPRSKVGSGVFNKRAGVLRIQFTPVQVDRTPQPVLKDRPDVTVQRSAGEDQLITSKAFAFVTAERDGAPSRATVQARGVQDRAPGYQDKLGPLNIGGSRYGNHPFHFSEIPDAQVVERVEKSDSTHIVIVTTQSKGNVTFETKCVVWTEPELPVLKSRDLRVLQEGAVVQEFRSETSELQNCPGGWVPRRICLVRTTPGKTSSVTLWRSGDLGAHPPTDESFEIPLTPITELVGIEHVETNAAGRRVLSPMDLSGGK